MIEYRYFRKTADGNWHRREPDGTWTTLHVIRANPTRYQERNGGKTNRAPTTSNEWIWL